MEKCHNVSEDLKIQMYLIAYVFSIFTTDYTSRFSWNRIPLFTSALNFLHFTYVSYRKKEIEIDIDKKQIKASIYI